MFANVPKREVLSSIMKGKRGNHNWLYVVLAYVLLFHCVKCKKADSRNSLSDEVNDIPYLNANKGGKSSLDERTSDISDILKERNVKLQSGLNIKSVGDAMARSEIDNKLISNNVETFEELVTNEGKHIASTDPNGKPQESPTDHDEQFANALTQNGLQNEKINDNFREILDNLDKPDDFKALLADHAKLLSNAGQPNEPEEEVNSKDPGNLEENTKMDLVENNVDSVLPSENKLFTSKDANTGLLAASVNTLAQTPANVTLLDKMRDLMNYENFIADFSMLDSFDWFDESSTVKSRIRRTSEPYHYRRFQQPLRAYIPENSPPGSKVLEIPRNFDGMLEIVYPEFPFFRIRSGTGILETTDRFDFETKKVFMLIIRDSETDDSSFYNHDVIVYVTDENDNEPKFTMTSFTAQVNRASRVGSFVTQLNASDPDSRERGRLGFIIGDQNSRFTVNPRTWVMETNGKPLDTSQSSYPVNLRVFDQGYPRRESPTVVLNVNEANNPPRFSQSEYTFTYPETTLPGVVFARVVAMSLSNIPVSYEIVPSSDAFAINQRGELSLKRSIDYETAGSLASVTITVRARELTDSDPLSSQVSVTLVVTNYDENPAIFTEVIYNAQIDEDVGIGTFVMSVSVMDCDCSVECQCTGNEFNFALMDANGFFEISETGDIRTAKNFDYDIQAVYQFDVVAWDRTGDHDDSEPARSFVRVTLRDVNTNAPKFTESRYRFVVDEDSEIDHHVGVVQATDKDSLGSPLTYSITSSSPKSGLFRIPDSRFGIVVVASPLRDETESVFILTVEASDGVQSSQTTVEVLNLLYFVLIICFLKNVKCGMLCEMIGLSLRMGYVLELG